MKRARSSVGRFHAGVVKSFITVMGLIVEIEKIMGVGVQMLRKKITPIHIIEEGYQQIPREISKRVCNKKN